MAQKPFRHPSHKPFIYDPRRTPSVIVSESVPIRRVRDLREHCKYCYRTHTHWWLMKREEFYFADDPVEWAEPSDVYLCGYCEHTSKFFRDDKEAPGP